MKYLLALGLLLGLLTSCGGNEEKKDDANATEQPAGNEDYAFLDKPLDAPNKLYEDTAITVSSFEEFYHHLGSNRTLVLNMKEMKLPERYKGVTNLNLELNFGLVVRGLSNLRIMTTGDTVHIVQPNPAYKVLYFMDCENIHIENIKAGHSPEQGGCSASVLAFDQCKNIFLRNCQLYGSGYEAITTFEVQNFTSESVHMYDCSYRILSLSRSNSFRFRNCTFRDNRDNGSGSFYLFNTDDVAFNGGAISNNARFAEGTTTQDLLPLFLIEDCEDIYLKDIRIANNLATHLSSDEKSMEIINITQEGNYWQKESGI